mmetsp:Transcript_4672/g.16743  ORF Transcript_4672/g.16743 Transcript_4672/m.16743 type:complete len:541 (-) Transcript_4672:1403-3025(-)
MLTGTQGGSNLVAHCIGTPATACARRAVEYPEAKMASGTRASLTTPSRAVEALLRRSASALAHQRCRHRSASVHAHLQWREPPKRVRSRRSPGTSLGAVISNVNGISEESQRRLEAATSSIVAEEKLSQSESGPNSPGSNSCGSCIREEGTTYEEALANAINILLGVGLLSIPFALREGGWTTSAVFMGLWATTLYTGKILAQCQRYPLANGGGLLQSYEDIGELAFGKVGRAFISAVLYIELLGTCGLFFILEGDHLELLFHGLSSKTLMLLSAPILIGTTWLGDLSKLAPLGRVGALASIALTGVIGYEWLSTPADSVVAQTSLLHLQTFPVTFGLAAFVYAGHAVFPCIYSSMKEPERYEEMLTTAYSLVGLVCVAIGFAGYSLYGDMSEQEITLNLPAGLLATVATALIVVNPCTKFALTLDPVAKFVERRIMAVRPATTSPEWDPECTKTVRTGLGLFCLYLATSVPSFAYVMSLIGSFLTMIVSVIFPSCCYLKIYGDELNEREKTLNGFVILVGTACAVSGTWSAIEGVVSSM